MAEEEEEEDYNDHDAFEWGRTAGAKLYAQNNPISSALPSALLSLFSNQEFREAIVVAGVSSDRIAMLPSTSSRAIPTRLDASLFMSMSEPIRLPDCMQQTLRRSPRKMLAIRACPTEEEKEEQSKDSTKDSKKSTNTAVHLFPVVSEVQSNMFPDLLKVKENQSESMADNDVFCIDDDDQSTGSDQKEESQLMDDLEESEAFKGTQCVTCQANVVLNPEDLIKTPEQMKKQNQLRELLWCSLGMEKHYDRSSHVFPFCKDCSKRLEEMMNICKQVKRLEEQFNKRRATLLNGIVKGFHPTSYKNKQEDNNLKTCIAQSLLDSSEKNFPGKDLLEKVEMICSQLNSNEGSKNSLNEGPRDQKKEQHNGGTVELHLESESEQNTETAVQNRYGYNDKELLKILTGKVTKDQSSGKFNLSFCCPKCPKIYKAKPNLKLHLEKHQNVEMGKFPCKVCDKKCESQTDLQNHLNEHTRIKPFVCNICHKTFASQKAKINHEKNHLKNSSFICPICEKNFSCKETLNCHKRLHSGEKPFKCSQCEKSFTQKSNFDDHLRRHKGFKPYECNICSQTYHRIRNMTAHFMKRHPKKEISYKRRVMSN